MKEVGVKRGLPTLMLVAAGLVFGVSTAAAAEIETYVGCDSTASAIPSHDCQLGASPGAFFETDEETEYEVCVEFPDGGFLCSEEELAEAGVLYVNQITTEIPGEHFVWWFVGEEEVGFWSFRITEPPKPGPAPTPPAPVAPPAVSPGPSVACLNAKKRVRQLRSRLHDATTPKAKTRMREKLKRARNTAGRLC